MRPADQRRGVPLPAAAGLRLGGRRADVELGGTDQTVQPADGARGPARLRSGAAGGAHDAAARGARWRAEDVEVLGQLRRADRAGRGDVRQAHVAPRRAHREVRAAVHRPWARATTPAWSPGLPTGRSIPTPRSGAWRARSSSCTTAQGRGRRAEAAFDRVHKQRELPDDVPEVAVPAIRNARRRGRLVMPLCAGAPRGPRHRGSRSEASRKLAAGAVRMNGERETRDGSAGGSQGLDSYAGSMADWAPPVRQVVGVWVTRVKGSRRLPHARVDGSRRDCYHLPSARTAADASTMPTAGSACRSHLEN